MKTAVAALIEKEIERKRLSGAMLQVNQKGKSILQEAFGTESFEAKLNAGNLVEVVAILPLILKLVERRRSKLALNHKLIQYFPEFGEKGKENVQIMNLLTHTSGLATEDFTKELLFPPGSKVAYSAQNFKLLPAVFEMVSGDSFHTYYQEMILDPMLMEQTELTEDYHLWTTMADLSRYATMIEQDGTYDYLKIINKKAVQLSKQNFTSFLNAHRGLGWSLEESATEGYGYREGQQTSLWFYPKASLNLVLHLIPFSEGEVEHLEGIHKQVHELV